MFVSFWKTQRETPQGSGFEFIVGTHPHHVSKTARRSPVDSEATLADISQKLDQLTDVVNNYTFSQSSRLSAPVSSTTTVPSPETVASSQCMLETPALISESEIEPALLAQVAFATSYVQQNFGANIAPEELALSLDRLCQILREDQQVNRSRHVQQGLMLSGLDVGDMKMPPLGLAISCIQKLRCTHRNNRDRPRRPRLMSYQIQTRQFLFGHGTSITSASYLSTPQRFTQVRHRSQNSSLSIPICPAYFPCALRTMTVTRFLRKQVRSRCTPGSANKIWKTYFPGFRSTWRPISITSLLCIKLYARRPPSSPPCASPVNI